MSNQTNHDQQQDTGALSDSIRRVFPAEPYTGKVTPSDGAFDPLGDEQALFEGLQSRRWTEVELSLLYSHPDGFVLLTDEAHRAFVAAWLVCSLEGIEAENEVRDFVLFTYSHSVQQLRTLDADQRTAVRSLLTFFVKRLANSFMKDRALEALANLDWLERKLDCSAL